MLRPSASEMACHPFFWSDEKKLNFLQEASDRVESEKPDSDIRMTLETQAPRVVGRHWDTLLGEAILGNLGKYRKYRYDSIRDCLRVIRNKRNHYRDLPPEVQEELGALPSGFLSYFQHRFPSLLMYVYAFVAAHCASEPPLASYVEGVSEQFRHAVWEEWCPLAPVDDSVDGRNMESTRDMTPNME